MTIAVDLGRTSTHLQSKHIIVAHIGSVMSVTCGDTANECHNILFQKGLVNPVVTVVEQYDLA